MIKVPTIASPQAIGAAHHLVQHLPAVAVHQPSGSSRPAESFNPSLTALVANTPVSSAPSVPPAAVHAESIQRIVVAEPGFRA